MAYNVFKRPMFKRGGSTTGTGIMSHVEPRVNAAMGFPNFGVTQMPPQSQLDAFRQAEIDRQNRLSKGFNILGPAFTMPEDYPGTVSDYRNMLRQQQQAEKEFEQNISGGIAQLQPGQSAFDAVFAPVDAEIIKQKAEKQKLLETKETIKDEPAYEGTDIKSEVKRESEMLRELLKDDKYSRGEAALIIAGALAEPGTFADKVKKATELAAPVARKRREEDKAITLAAYKLAKEKEQQQIKAGKETDYMRNMRDVARSRVGKPGYEGKSEREILNQLLGAKTEDAEARYYYLKSAGKEIDNRTEDIIETKKELAKLEPGSSKYEKKKAELDEMLRIFDIKYSSLPEFETIYKGRKEALGLKEGGRVNRAMGSDEDGETSDIVSSQVSFTPETTTKDSISNETVVEKPVENLTFAELRDRLPPEITDDVVQMLASSEEALQDFAYIRTQQDINQFNVKYGVNLVIPPTQA